MGKYRTRELTQRVRYALLAGVAGAFLIPQVAAAAPTGEHDMTNGVTVGRAATASGTGTDTNITATAANNVIKWADYSVKQGETVNYDGKNYLNIVTGGNTSAINGAIKNTGGDVYLVNPNGVIFGKTASVNVGNLYVSTQEESTLNLAAFKGSGASPLSTTVTDVGKADVVNMGSITANKVEVYGRSIRILDAANVHATTSPVILHIDEETNGGYAHIGYQSGSVPSTSDYEIHKKFTPPPPSPSSPPLPPTTVVAAATAADNYYQLVSTPTEFQNINSDLTKNYMLANDIDFYDAVAGAKKAITPIGGNSSSAFTGKFDGNFYKIKNFSVGGAGMVDAALFGRTNAARIDNVGVTDAVVTGEVTGLQDRFAGGIVAHATGTTLNNVYVTNTKVTGEDGYHGGVVGYTKNTHIGSSYSKATVGDGGGVIGFSDIGTVVEDTYSDTKKVSGSLGTEFIYIIDPSGGTTVKNSYSVGTYFTTNETALTTEAVNTYKIDPGTGKASLVGPTPNPSVEAHTIDTYAAWGNAINNTGAPGAKWRIYEGRTLPLLTAFMDGTATATYDTRYFNADGTLNSDGANTAKSNKGADIETTYNSQYVKIVGKDASGADVVGGKSNVVTYAGAMQYNADGTPNLDHIYDYVSTTGTNDFDKTNGIRNAGTKAILWSDQDGPNLRGVNVTIGKRKVDMTVAGDFTAERQYNGKLDVKDAFIEKVLGGISTDGFTREDSDPNHPTVSLNTTGFTATMVDKHVGTGKVANFGGSIGLSGEDKDNYDFDGNLAGKTGKVNIYKAPLLLSFRKKKADDRVYDGTSVVRDDAMKQSVSPGNISINKTIAAGSRGEVMTDETGNADVLALADITDPKYTDIAGNEQIHQGAHKLQYTNVKLRTNGIYSSGQDYELYYTPDSGTEEKVTNDTVYLDGSITRRQIKTGDFKVYHKTDNSAADATKVYDGTATYDLNDPRYSDIYLSSNVGATDDDTGVVARDQGHITFLLQNGTTATFMTDELTPSETKNVKTAKKIAYKVHADADTHTDGYGGHLLDDYWVVNDKDTALTESTNFNATGKGTITPKALTATVVNNHITKVYDTKQNQTDGNRNDIIGDALVTLSGFATVNGVLETRTNTSTAMYASSNVAWDNAANAPTSQTVTYTAKFDRGTGDEVDNYTFDQTPNTTTVMDSAAVAGNYKGTITPRPITITMGTVDKIYDGTAVNTKSNITGLAGTTAGDNIAATVLADDGITAATLKAQHAAMLSAGTAHSSFGRGTGSSFAEYVNASNGTEHDVRYQNVGNVLQEALAAAKKHNYTIDDTIYGKGTINRRLIEKSDFQVRDKDGGIANATKVYDGTSTFQLKNGETLVAKTAATGSDTGVVDKDKDNIYFTMTGENGHFTSDAAGANHTSHKSEAKHVAYDVIADSHDKNVSPLTNYYFGTSGTDKRDLERVNADNPDAVTASGRITSAKIQAQTKKLKEKVYDGLAEHTDGNRNILTGSEIVALPLITDATGQPMNTSSAAYINKNVERDSDGVIIEKAVNYTAQLKGKYADDYEIVDADNHVISTLSGTGDSKTVTATRNNVANMGKITPRKLNMKMGDVSKTYDGTSTNTDSSVTEITDAPQTSVIGTILTGDGITTGALKTAWDNMRSGGTASSSYGNGTGSAFHADANASNGTPHDVRYTKMDEAFKDAFGTTAAGNYTVDKTVYGKGTINRKAIDPNNFDIVDAHGNASHATKVYDGTSNYSVPSGWNLRPSTGHGTGVITADEDKINFAIDPNKGAHFTKADNTTRTANAYEATRVAYNVKATADNGYEYLLKNYTLNGQNLESGNATATGAGTITRRTINVGLAEASGIDKVYDGNANLIDTANRRHQTFADADGRANVGYAVGTTNANKLVRTKNGYGVDDSAQVTVQGSYADKNVARSGGNVTTKSITYNVKIAGDAGKNYYLTDGSTMVNAENGMNLSATGTITPRDLSGAFKKVTKVYDGTKNVDPSKVGFEIGANGVVSGDAVDLASGHMQEFESENVRGKDTTWPAPDGTRQHNWVNYSNLSLTGADAGNYTLSLGATAKGLGEITPFELNPNTVDLAIGTATKTYDGTKTVKWTDGSSALSDQKKYITSATVNINGNAVNVLNDLKLTSAEYDTKVVDNGRFANRVTYNLSYTGTSGNFSLGGASTFAKQGDGVITPKDVTVTLKTPFTKVYDATTDVIVKRANNQLEKATANDLVTLTGLVAGDGATNESTATFDNKNVGTNKNVTYDIKLDTASAGNYKLKYNDAEITAPITQAGNTITKRKVNVTFGEQHKSYDGLSTNTSIDASVSAADAAVLNHDVTGLAVANKLTNLAATGAPPNIVSNYGKRTGTGFTPDANAGTNKDVQYAGLAAAMNTSLGGNAGNYEFDTDGYGTGTITKANINAGDVNFVATNATKTYDGTDRVKFDGSGASNDVRNYITTARVQLNGNWVDLKNDLVMDMNGTKYDSANAGTGIGVTYKFHLNNDNINISGDNNFTKTAQGTIDRRVLKLGLAQDSAIDKIYDANAKLIDTSTRHYDKFIDDDARGNVIYAAGTTNDNKLVRTANGAAVNDGAKMTITANYVDNLTSRTADKNVARDGGGNVTAKGIAYNVRIDAANGGKNYKLSDGTTTVDAENANGLNMNASGTISPRKITLAFADADKMYDTMSENTLKNISSVTPGNSDGRGAATLTADGITAATFDMTGVASDFGKVTMDATFTADPNVVLNSSGTVNPRSKDVQYRNLKDTLNAQPYAGNYEIADTSYGKGAITKRTVTRNDFDIQIDPATKEYDGTDKVVWTDPTTHISYNDLEHAKNYFTLSTLKLRNSVGTVIATKNINLADIELLSAAYNGTNVVGTNQVDYGIRINTTNFDFTGARDDVRHTAGTITPRDLATKLPTHLIKEYDGETTFNQDNKDFVNAMANEKLTGIVARDANKVHLAVTGTYSSKNASAETKAEAEARTPAQAQRTVDYTLTLSGDAATLANYTIAGHDTTHTVTGKAADIYKKTLTVDVARKEKDYDGTAAVNNLAAGDITFSGLVGSETLSLDSGALNKVQGQYLDSSGNADANVSRDVHRNVLDKAVKYTGFNDALTDLATRNNTAKNYRVADGGKSYTVNAAKGRINPLSINPNHPTDGVTTTFDAAGAMKIYDRTRAVKYNGQSTSDALKNYLTSATVRVGTQTIDIKDELTIDPNATAYDNKNAGTGKTVTYTLKYTGNNFAINDFTRNSTGEIKQKDVKVLPVGTLTKVYDGTRYVYANGDDSIRTMHGDQRVTNGDSVVELENGGIIAGDSVQNNSTAVYADKNAGTGKTVVYTPSITGADAGNYRLVDVFGHAIPSGTLTTTDNVIQKRRLNIGFDGLNGTLPVRKSYDATTTNDKITARITDDPNGHTRTVLQRDGMGIFGDRLAQLNNGNIQSDYGYGSTDATFRADANADARKDVQYRGVGDALRNILGGNAANYDFNETAYSDGAITRANVTRSVFDLGFDMARKEYDGTKTVVNPARNLTTKRVRLGGNWNTLQDGDVLSVTGEYAHKNAAASQPVDYKVKFNTRNFNITDSADNTVAKQGSGEILRRKIMANPVTATKTYDKTSALMNVAKDGEGHVIDSADRLVKFSHYGGHGDAIIANDVVENRSTGEYADQNVAWEPKANANPNAMWQDRNRVKNKAVNYQFLLAGDDALNYELVDGSGNTLSTDGLDANGKNTIGYAPAAMETGRINPYEVRLAGDDQTRWINEGLPDSYTGTPQGRGYTTALGETLPGEIRYGSPSARLRWGDYPIEGEYIPATDSETVYQNYLFKSSGTLHIGPYIPDYEYYKAMTQVSKMTPDEYAYENASLDRTNHYSRKPTAQVDPVPPAINVVKDGVDIRQNDINVLDETVYTIVDEVFG